MNIILHIVQNVHSLNNRACGRCRRLNLVTSHRSESSYSHTAGVCFGPINASIRVWSRSSNKHLIRSRSTMDPYLRTQLTWIKWFHLECVITFTMRKRVLQMLPEKTWRQQWPKWVMLEQPRDFIIRENEKKIKKSGFWGTVENTTTIIQCPVLHIPGWGIKNAWSAWVFFPLFFSILNELTIL